MFVESCFLHCPLLFTMQSRLLMTLKKKPFENIVGKEENASLSTMFSTLPKTNINFFNHIYFVVCKCFQFWPVQNFVVW